jgi:hypothetical protein
MKGEELENLESLPKLACQNPSGTKNLGSVEGRCRK